MDHDEQRLDAQVELDETECIEIDTLEERDVLCEVKGACLCTSSCGCSSCSCVVVCY